MVGVATHGVGLAAAAAVLLGVAAAVIGLWPRSNALERLGLIALVAVVAGLALGIRAYDERFIYDNPAPVWDVLSLVGFLLTLAGALMLAGAAIGVLVLGAVRLSR